MAQAAEQQIGAQTKPCPECQSNCKLDAKFCPKCGHGFVAPSISTEPSTTSSPNTSPKQVEIEEVALSTGDVKSCPGCGNSLKLSAKFCGKCGLNFEQDKSVPKTALDHSDQQTVKFTGEISVAAPSVPVVASVPSEQFADALQAKVHETQSTSAPVQPAFSGKPEHQEETRRESRSKNYVLPIAIVLLLCLMGGGAFWWFKLRSAESAVTATPSLTLPAAASAVASVGTPAALPDAAGSASAPPVASQDISANPPSSKGETEDDRKLLNAIDQYLDKKK